ncbi:hypothetical protein C9374_005472 [Naegleria lovaniensis]|uniref:Uncharacterized protein n=1 Tax=Naegleria lovaniensis TaxID=51637 RepID=A0AA88GL78_NAELO|nr:uncharacterized protein C9374_005472 [Naegleria lovaniensis]KAG2382270.1 hypothetical protein C9374_005472 [Naegleria lovaniensis]
MKPTGSRVIDFQIKLARYTEKQLNLALKVSNYQQNNIVILLFDNLTQSIDSEYQAQLSLIANTPFPPSPHIPQKSQTLVTSLSLNDHLHEHNKNHQIPSSPSTTVLYSTKYFYHILADYYYNNPHESEKLQRICLALLTNQYLPSIFALLFYRWMFDANSQSLSLIHINIFLKGVNRLFWSDVQNKTLKYASLYRFIQNDVLLHGDFSCFFDPINPYSSFHTMKHYSDNSEDDGYVTPDLDSKDLENVMKSPVMDEFKDIRSSSSSSSQTDDDEAIVNIQNVIQTKKIDLISLIAKYYFYYENRDSRYKLKPYIIQLSKKCAMDPSESLLFNEMEKKNRKYNSNSQIDHFSNENLNTLDEKLNFMFVLISDMFVNENIAFLSHVSDEEIILSLLTRFKLFSELEITSRTMVKLQAAIYAFTRPGTPYFPSRAVRHKATSTLDELFPSGKYARWWLSTSFRLLYYGWPMSLLNWVKNKCYQIVQAPIHAWEFLSRQFTFEPPQLVLQYDGRLCNDSDYLNSSTDEEADDHTTYSITFNK